MCIGSYYCIFLVENKSLRVFSFQVVLVLIVVRDFIVFVGISIFYCGCIIMFICIGCDLFIGGDVINGDVLICDFICFVGFFYNFCGFKCG